MRKVEELVTSDDIDLAAARETFRAVAKSRGIEARRRLEPSEEVLVVAKEARVVEEISLNKLATERAETITDPVRRSDLVGQSLQTSAYNPEDIDWSEHFRSHLQSTNPGAAHDRYLPAYLYGRDLANDPAYGGYAWEANEVTFRSRWEERNPGTWDEFRPSILFAYSMVRRLRAGNGIATVR